MAVALDRATGVLVRPPEVVSRGFKDLEDMPELLQKVSTSVAESLDHKPNYPIDWDLTAATGKGHCEFASSERDRPMSSHCGR